MAPSRPVPVYAQPSDSSSEEEDEDSDETMLDQKPVKDLSENEQEEEEDDDDDDEEEEEDDDEEEVTDDDEETVPQPSVEKQNVKKQPVPLQPVPLQISLPLASESEDTESEDFDMHDVPSPSTPNFTIKPCTTSKPIDNPSIKSKKSPVKADPPSAVVAAITTTTATQARSSNKRPLESKENGKDSPKKRGKTSNVGEEKSGSNRLWSDNDQIAILKGMIDYQSNSGADPLADAAAFHDLMKKSLHVDVSKGQMIDKIRRMKKKYQINAVKGENGQDPVFAKPHDSQSFELSKRIWGVVNGGETTTAANNNNNKVSNGSSSARRRVKKKVTDENPQATSSQENGILDVKMDLAVTKEETKEDFWKKYPLLEKSLSEIPVLGKEFAKEAMLSVGNSSANALEEKWRKIKIEEIELYKKKIDLIFQQTEMIQQTFKSP